MQFTEEFQQLHIVSGKHPSSNTQLTMMLKISVVVLLGQLLIHALTANSTPIHEGKLCIQNYVYLHSILCISVLSIVALFRDGRKYRACLKSLCHSDYYDIVVRIII